MFFALIFSHLFELYHLFFNAISFVLFLAPPSPVMGVRAVKRCVQVKVTSMQTRHLTLINASTNTKISQDYSVDDTMFYV